MLSQALHFGLAALHTADPEQSSSDVVQALAHLYYCCRTVVNACKLQDFAQMKGISALAQEELVALLSFVTSRVEYPFCQKLCAAIGLPL